MAAEMHAGIVVTMPTLVKRRGHQESTLAGEVASLLPALNRGTLPMRRPTPLCLAPCALRAYILHITHDTTLAAFSRHLQSSPGAQQHSLWSIFMLLSGCGNRFMLP